TVVDVDPATAFHIFTQEIDLWWKRGVRYRRQNGQMRFDSGRLLEDNEPIGRVLGWEPGARLLLELWTWDFRPGEHTQVEVHFEPVAHGTRVTVEHSGWERRLTSRAEFRTTVGLWWGALLPGLGRVATTAGMRSA